jgi:ribose transport system permease protein
VTPVQERLAGASASGGGRKPSGDPPASAPRNVADAAARYAIPVVVVGVLAIVIAIYVPEFFGVQNLLNVGRQASVVGVVAVGMTFVILTAGIDLSVGAILGLTSVLMAILLRDDVAPLIVILACLGAGMAAGIVNAFGITRLKLQPFIMTLATGAVFTGLALRISDGTQQQIPLFNGGVFSFLGIGKFLGLPGPLVVFIVVAVIGWIVLRYLPFGRYIYAVGSSQEAARLSGIRVWPVLFGAYAIAGLCSAMGAIMATSRLNVGDPNAGTLTTLDAIAAVVIGGTSLMGGSGGMLGSVLGAFLLAALANVLNLIGVSPFDQQMVKGLVIILAVLWASFGLQRTARIGRRKSTRTEPAGS